MKTNLAIVAVVSVLLTAGLSACKFIGPDGNDPPVARVFDKYLYKSDLLETIPESASKQDSIVIAKNHIDSWVKNQLMLRKAEEALSDDQKNVEKKIEEYRSSLLIYSYRQKLLQQKMDTVVTEDEIVEYYESNIDNFILSDEIIKAIFVKVPITAPKIKDVRNWTKSGSLEDIDQLEKYSINYAEKFDVFDNSWIYFKTLLEQIPLTIQQPKRYLRYTRNIETSDSLFHYFVHITDHKSEGDTTPLDLIRDDIKNILLNKRKIEFYNKLEKQVYNEGANRNQFEIY